MGNFASLLISFSLLFLHSYSFSQNIDSLKNIVETGNDDSIKVNVYIKLSKLYLHKEPDISKINLDSLLQLSHRTNNLFGVAEGYRLYGLLERNYGRIDQSISYYHKSINKFQELNDTTGVINSLMNLASGYSALGKLDSSIITFKTCLANPFFNNPKRVLAKASVFVNFGHTFAKNGNYLNAQKAFLDAEEIVNTHGNSNPKMLYPIYNGLCGVMKKIKDRKSQLDYAQLELNYARKLNDKRICKSWYNLGEAYADNQLQDSAQLYFRKILNAECSKGDVVYAYEGLANLAVKQNDYQKGVDFLNTGIRIAEETRLVGKKEQMRGLLGQCYYKTGDYEQAKSILEKVKASGDERINTDKFLILSTLKNNGDPVLFNRLDNFLKQQDSVYNTELVNSIEELKTKFDVEKKETENQLLKQEKELQLATIQQQRIRLWTSIAGIGLLVLISFLLFRQNKERKKTNTILSHQKSQIEEQNKNLALKKEKIETLHKELGHRVKNNLAFISALMNMQQRRLDNPEAKAAVKEGELRLQSMSLLHRKLHMGEQDQFSTSNYLKELTANLQNTFPFSGNPPKINIKTEDIELNGDATMRIGLIVNELVTNSFKYAFNNHNNPTINISLSQNQEDAFQLKYQDNGTGLPADININQIDSLGLKLIHTLTKQLNGTIEVSNQQGAHFSFNFPIHKMAV